MQLSKHLHREEGMKEMTTEQIEIERELRPETELEKEFLKDPDFQKGLQWGVPRYGHPEGEVYKHIGEVLNNIDALDVSRSCRTKLRIIAYTHDTFKYLEDKSIPRDWSRHHGVFARSFLQKYINTQSLLDIVELHDEAYYCWRLINLYNKPQIGQKRLNDLLSQIGIERQLYYLFFKCDTLTGDKNPAPLKWFESYVDDIEVIPDF